MLRHLRIQNFKAWKDTGNIELAPITVFLGTNSSGKSSIAQFLMMLKQTVEHNDPNEVLFTGDENSAVDVGTPFQMLYGHDTTQSLQFSYDWDVDTPFTASFESRFDDSLKGRLTRGKDCFFIGTRIFFNNAIKIREFAGAMEVEKIRYHVIHENVPVFSLSMEKENETGYQNYPSHTLYETESFPQYAYASQHEDQRPCLRDYLCRWSAQIDYRCIVKNEIPTQAEDGKGKYDVDPGFAPVMGNAPFVGTR